MQIWCRPQHQYLSLNSSDRGSGNTHRIAALIGGESLAHSDVGLRTDEDVSSSALVDNMEKDGAVQSLKFFRRKLHTHKPRTAAPVAAKILFGLGYCFFRQEKLKSVMN